MSWGGVRGKLGKTSPQGNVLWRLEKDPVEKKKGGGLTDWVDRM